MSWTGRAQRLRPKTGLGVLIAPCNRPPVATSCGRGTPTLSSPSAGPPVPFDPAEMEFVDNLSELERLPKIPKSISLGDQMGKLRLGQVPGPPSRQSHDGGFGPTGEADFSAAHQMPRVPPSAPSPSSSQQTQAPGLIPSSFPLLTH